MKTIELNAKKRELSTKGALRQLRLAGDIPATVYGGKKEAANMSVNGKQILALLKQNGINVVIGLKGAGVTDTVLVKELQRDKLNHQIIHVDFHRVSLTEKIEVKVPVHVRGEAPGVKLAGGILEHIQREVRVRCLPTEIPASVDVDVSKLELNQGLKVKDIIIPEGLELLTDKEQIVVNIVAPMEFKEEPVPGAAAAPGAPGAAAEPEVIAKGKKPEEGAEAAPAAGKEGAKAPAGKEAAKPAEKK